MPGIRRAQRHRPFGERTVDGVFRRGAEPDPLVAKAGLDTAGDHRVEHLAGGFVAHAVKQFAARPHLLQRRQIAAFVVHAGQAVADELFRDVCQAIAAALVASASAVNVCRLPDAVEHATRAVGDAAVEIAVRIAVERSAWRIRRVLRDVRHLQRLAVVERSVAAAMSHDDRMVQSRPRRGRARSARACPSPWCRRRNSPRPRCPAASGAPWREACRRCCRS